MTNIIPIRKVGPVVARVIAYLNQLPAADPRHR